MLVRAIERADGGVTIIRPVRRRRDGEDEAEYYDEVFGKAVANEPALAGRPYVDVDDDDLPERATRDRWQLVDGAVVVGPEIERPPTRDERILAAVERGHAVIDAAGHDPPTAATLKAILDGLGAAVMEPD